MSKLFRSVQEQKVASELVCFWDSYAKCWKR